MSRSTADMSRLAVNAVWSIGRAINGALPEGKLPNPSWAPGPLLRYRERVRMDTGVPRRTLSLCPECNREAVDTVVRNQGRIDDFRDRPGIVEAEIVEEAGRILMRKACERHGPFEDVLSDHPDFFGRMERLAFGADFECIHDQNVHNHGPNSIRRGRGSYLIVDLTNRCNMVCSPCFMEANATSYIHELGMEDVKAIFNNAVSFKPQREVNVLFSGGEPTLSPIFLEAVRHAKSMGFHRLHVATNGISFAKNRDFVSQARAAGLHAVYLQCDGVSDAKNRHRQLGNYMEVKRRALENIAAAGMRTTLQVTVANGLNNDGLGDIVRFAIQNTDKIHGVLFQPIMFTGRDESVTADERYARRYTLSRLAYDLQDQTSIDWQPMRDWFPVSSYGIFAHLCDVLHPEAKIGSLFTDIHPNHGVFSPLLVDVETKQAIPVTMFFNLERFLQDIIEIADSGTGPTALKALLALSILRNFNQKKAPSGLGVGKLPSLLRDCFYRVAGSGDRWSEEAYSYAGRWKIMFCGAMWFQDSFNYDFSTISNATTPVSTQLGEINFCVYNGGRWRKVVEHLNRTATLTEWHKTHPRHEIYTKGKNVDLGQPRQATGAPLVQIESERLSVPTGVSGHRE